ncbi:hypothetical protein TK90_0005 [Thioalkalivibrio sp. K90mix]|uniref:hypothetical protein n=1 Tax=Thioalkalivibrio sp. (strain K90mix) TaxID=396595 RepID=UPI000195AA04|nr:hypothetical protein [Thioalkalivibrio sp. K90mix]ADC70522.1 hypothetical protein TK90_0005 [Thioalkalivibrio sp. K90mix]
MAIFVIVTIVGLVGLTLTIARLYSHLAVQERQVVGAWDQLERLLVQRNGHLQKVCMAAGSGPSAVQHLHRSLQRQETARRRGDLSTVAKAEREIRALWDSLYQQDIDIKKENVEESARRVVALDQAIRDTLIRYNAALQMYRHTCRSPFYAPIAWLGGMGRYTPLQPPSSDPDNPA